MINYRHPIFSALPYDYLINNSSLQKQYGVLLKFLYEELDDTYEIIISERLFLPKLDILILRKKHGVFLINVESFNSKKYSVEFRNNLNNDSENLSSRDITWYYDEEKYPSAFFIDHNSLNKKNKKKVSSPFLQPLEIIERFINSLSKKAFEKIKYADRDGIKIINCVTFFYDISRKDLTDWFAKYGLTEYVKKYAQNYECICNDELVNGFNNNQFNGCHFFNKDDNHIIPLFSDDLYNEIKNPLYQLDDYILRTVISEEHYSDEQQQIIDNILLKIKTKNDKQRLICGITGGAGTGKTQILAKLFTECQKMQLKIFATNYNITLRNFFYYLLRKAGNQSSNCILNSSYNELCLHYHKFMKKEVFPIIYENDPTVICGYDIDMSKNIDNVLSEERKLDVLFVDEIQDFYKPNWLKNLMAVVKENGFIVFVNAQHQTIYNKGILDPEKILCRHNDMYLKYNTNVVYRYNYFIASFLNVFVDRSYNNIFLSANNKGDSEEWRINYFKFYKPDFFKFIDFIKKIKEKMQSNISVLVYDNSLGMIIDFLLRERNIYLDKDIKRTFPSIEYMLYEFVKRVPEEIFLKCIFSIELPELWNDSKKEKITEKVANLYQFFEEKGNYEQQKNDSLRFFIRNFIRMFSFHECIQMFQALYNYDKKNYFHPSPPKVEGQEPYCWIIRKAEVNARQDFFAEPHQIQISTLHSFKGFDSKNVVVFIEDDAQKKSGKNKIYACMSRAREKLIIFDVDPTNTFSDFFLEYVGDKYKKHIQTVKEK